MILDIDSLKELRDIAPAQKFEDLMQKFIDSGEESRQFLAVILGDDRIIDYAVTKKLSVEVRKNVAQLGRLKDAPMFSHDRSNVVRSIYVKNCEEEAFIEFKNEKNGRIRELILRRVSESTKQLLNF